MPIRQDLEARGILLEDSADGHPLEAGLIPAGTGVSADRHFCRTSHAAVAGGPTGRGGVGVLERQAPAGTRLAS